MRLFKRQLNAADTDVGRVGVGVGVDVDDEEKQAGVVKAPGPGQAKPPHPVAHDAALLAPPDADETEKTADDSITPSSASAPSSPRGGAQAKAQSTAGLAVPETGQPITATTTTTSTTDDSALKPATSAVPQTEADGDTGAGAAHPPSLSVTPWPPGSTQPPPLPYTLHTRIFSITWFWFLIVAETFLVPVGLYYGLWFGTTLNHGALFAIITSVFGFVTGYEYTIRGYLLLLKSPRYRPLRGSRRFWDFDSVQWVLVAPYTVLTGLLIGFSIPTQPLTRGLATPMPLGMIILGGMLAASAYAHTWRWRLRHFRLSSHVVGDVVPPLLFCIIEDVVAVDGRGGQTYRRAALDRYHASPRFRRMLVQLTWFWSLPALVLGFILLILIFTVRKEVAYGLGWSVPDVWAGLWTAITVAYVRRKLAEEKRCWIADQRIPLPALPVPVPVPAVAPPRRPAPPPPPFPSESSTDQVIGPGTPGRADRRRHDHSKSRIVEDRAGRERRHNDE